MREETIVFWVCIIGVIILTLIQYAIATSDLPIVVKMFWLG